MSKFRLYVIEGNDKGKIFDIPIDTPINAGRSSTSEIHLSDSLLSRHHCSFDVRDNILWITDLASSNGTEVNDKVITDAALKYGDKITIGDTKLVVVDESDPEEFLKPKESPQIIIKKENTKSKPVDNSLDKKYIDLGLDPPNSTNKQKPSNLLKNVIFFAITLIIVLCLVKVYQNIGTTTDNNEDAIVEENTSTIADNSLRLFYTRVEGSENNIFRYELSIDTDAYINVKIDDLKESRQIDKRSDKPIDEKRLQDLTKRIKDSGVLSLDSSYTDSNRYNSWNELNITIIIGKDTKTINVKNAIIPPALETFCEDIRFFINNEMGLWALEYSKEKILELAEKDYSLAKDLYLKKEIAADNLFKAIRHYKAALSLIDVIVPKPEFYEMLYSEHKEATEELNNQYKELSLTADLAINNKNLDEASKILKEILEMIPDRNDQRNKDSYRRLIDIEAIRNNN